MSDQALAQRAVFDAAIERCRGLIGGLLPALHAIQDQLGYIPDAAIERLADGFNLSRAEVHGTVSFYHDFRTTPPAAHVLKVCRAEACQAMGCDAIGDTASALGRDFTVENVYCLGNCACAPAVLLDGQLHGRLTATRLRELASRARSRGPR